MKLEHVAINVPDAQAAAKWYAENLGLRIMLSSDQTPYMTFVGDEDGSMIELYTRTDVAPPDYAAINPFNLHLAFAEEDIETRRDALVAAGATVVGDITTTPEGNRLLFLRDPWNVPLQLVKRKEPLA